MRAKRGFILMNTGAPTSSQEFDQRRYLKEVSRDPHVTDLPALLDEAVHPNRTPRTSTAYKAIWTTDGAPLICSCKKIRNALQDQQDAAIEIGMLYGDPPVSRAIGKLLDQQVDEIGILPLFPQYSVETFQNCIDKVCRELRARRSKVLLRVVPPFYDHPAYINLLAQKVEGSTERILFNYRGLSLHHLTKPDRHGHCMSSMTCCCEASAAHDTCYRFQCLKTSQLIAKAASLSDTGYFVSFQSQRGPVKCIEPYTEEILRQLPQEGYRKIVIISPSHFCDNVETLQELDVEGREIFLKAGGESYRLVQGLNDSDSAIQCIQQLISESDHWSYVREHGRELADVLT